MDVLTAAQRSYCMSKIRGKDTKPEILVRRLVHASGFRFRLHRADLPGKPDLVFARLRKVILVHGCFWHVHRCRNGQVKPSTNSEFWKRKREATRTRDKRNLRKLKAMGWDAMVVWECQTRDLDKLAKLLFDFLSPLGA